MEIKSQLQSFNIGKYAFKVVSILITLTAAFSIISFSNKLYVSLFYSFDTQNTCEYEIKNGTPGLHLTKFSLSNKRYIFILTKKKAGDFTNKIETGFESLDQVERALSRRSIRLIKNCKSFIELNSNCKVDSKSLQNIAIIVPYKSRSDNLKSFLFNMHVYLTRQKVKYGMYVI
jgi:hypothetical protein